MALRVDNDRLYSSMGVESSSIKSEGSYYGTTQFGDLDEQSLEATVRELRVERIYDRAPHMRPTAPTAPTKTVHIQTVVSISDPEPHLRFTSGTFVLSFGFKSEAPCRLVVTGDGLINAIALPIIEQRTTVAAPLPVMNNLVLEVTPDVSDLPHKSGFAMVSKHVLTFEYRGRDESNVPQFEYATHQLIGEEQSAVIEVHRKVPFVGANGADKCVVCLDEQVAVPYGQCNHMLLCNGCSVNRSVILSRCPACDVTAS